MKVLALVPVVVSTHWFETLQFPNVSKLYPRRTGKQNVHKREYFDTNIHDLVTSPRREIDLVVIGRKTRCLGGWRIGWERGDQGVRATQQAACWSRTKLIVKN